MASSTRRPQAWAMSFAARWPTQRRRRGWLLWISLCLMTPIICFALYSAIVTRSGTAVLPSSWLPDADANGVQPDSHTDEAGDSLNDGDASILRPEQHIHRQPHSIRLEWNITKEPRRPDGVLKDVYLINGQFPGPTIEARSGDQLEVTVINGISDDAPDGLAIHWHGMFMKGVNEMDGVVGVSQCTVLPGASFTYAFEIPQEQHGTFWYHAHSAVKRADGLFGGLIVHKPADQDDADSDLSRYQYDGEKLLLIGDWYHASADSVIAEYKDFRSFAYEPAPDSLLINGVGSYNCSDARPGAPVDCIDTEPPAVQVPGKRATRLRVINIGASSGYSLQLEKATFQLVTVDGGGLVSDATPRSSTIGVIYPGERVDLLLLPVDESAAASRDIVSIILDQELMPLWNPALTSKQSFALTWTDPVDTTFHHKTRDTSIAEIYDIGYAEAPNIPDTASVRNEPSEMAVLYTSLGINSFKDDEPWGELNHTSWVWKDPGAKPLLAMDNATWTNGTVQANPLREFYVPWFEAGEERWLELVVNNVDDKGHPFHLHGYEFYVVASRQSDLPGRTYNPFDDDEEVNKERNLDTPLRKDTVYIKPRGYVVLRFPLNNPGLWLMHCHVLWHQAVGMGVVLQVGNVTEETAKGAGQSCRVS